MSFFKKKNKKGSRLSGPEGSHYSDKLQRKNSLLASSSLPIKPPRSERDWSQTRQCWDDDSLFVFHVGTSTGRWSTRSSVSLWVCAWAFSRERRKRRRRGGSLKGIDRWQRSGTQSRWPTISLSLCSWPQRRSWNTTMSLPACLAISSLFFFSDPPVIYEKKRTSFEW